MLAPSTLKYYLSPEVVVRFQQTKTLYVFDLDHTLSIGVEKPSEPKELEAQAMIRHHTQRGIVMFSSARTPELMMDSAAYKEWKGLKRPQPRCFYDGAIYHYRPLEQLSQFQYVLNPDIINGFGTTLNYRLGNGYQTDMDYAQELKLHCWRTHALAFLLGSLDNPAPGTWKHLPPGEIGKSLPLLEDPESYRNGRINTDLLEGRIQVTFTGENAFEKKQEFKARLREMRFGQCLQGESEYCSVVRELAVIDESSPHKTPSSYTSYLIPRRGSKERALNRVISQLHQQTGVRVEEMRVVVFGDTLTDLLSGLYAAIKADVTFVLAGGSRLIGYLWNEHCDKEEAAGRKLKGEFAGESLHKWFNYAKKGRQGMFSYWPPLAERPRRIIFASAFTDKIAAESLLELLTERKLWY